VLVIALGIAVGSASSSMFRWRLERFSPVLSLVDRITHCVRRRTPCPFRDAFAVLFFVSVGMLLNPTALLDSPALVGGTVAVMMIGKPLATFIITWLMRYPFATSLSVAVALAQIGEFSFMLSRVGRDLGMFTAWNQRPIHRSTRRIGPSASGMDRPAEPSRGCFATTVLNPRSLT
jgi:monovalent cation:H+ antiporter-2, CPA2 family